MGRILDKSRRDYKRFSQADFSTEITFIGTSSIVVKGLASKHHMSIDANTGIPVNSLNAHITVNEQVLIDAGIVTRNTSKQHILKGKKVSWIDASGESFIYLIKVPYPSDTFGMIVCELEAWE